MTNQLTKTVLIVDDDRSFLDSLEQFLLQHGYQCEIAWDADTAMEKIRGFSIDIVVADMVLPKKDGLQLMNEAQKILPDLNFIIMTGYVDDYSYVDIIFAGASDYITKPFVMMELVARIERVEREKRLMMELRSTNERLQQTVQQVNEMIGEVKQRDRAKSSLLANISHEVRTPLTGILGFTDILTATALDNEQIEYTKNIKMSGEVILSLIDDFLDSSKIEAGQMKLEQVKFDLETLCYDVVDLIRPQLYGRPVELLCRISKDLPVKVIGDPYRVRQVLINLMSNAVKFTANGEVELAIATGEIIDGFIDITISVRDTGVGIPDKDIEDIFEPFKQSADSVVQDNGGTGLGLYISKQISGLMGGDILVQSEPDNGSIFSFSARMLVDEGNWAYRHDLFPDLKGRRVLAVDSNSTNLEIMAQFLESVGVSSETRTTVDEMKHALAEAEEQDSPFDLCIISLELAGLQAQKDNDCRIIRKTREMVILDRAIPVIAIAEPFFGNAQKCEQAGFNEFITKPVKRDVLFNVMQDLIGRREKTGADEAVEDNAADQQQTILLVEDNPVNQKLLQTMLTKANYSIEVAGDGEDALDKIFSGGDNYRLILMDVQMPGMDGITTTKEIRRWERQTGRNSDGHIPIIAVTANISDQKQYFEAGMDDFLAKPIKRENLFSMLEKWAECRC